MSTTTATQTIVQGGGMEARTVKEPTGAISFKAVPVIDLSPMDGKDPAKLEELVSQVYDACTQVGFFYVKNHGISHETTENIKAQSARFAKELPLEKKMELDRQHNDMHLGYGPYETEPRPGALRTHRFESFMIGREAQFDREYGSKVGPEHDAQNQWPKEEDLPGFKATVGSYFGDVLSLSRKLVQVIALSLKLDKTFFDDKLDRPGCLLSLNYYTGKPQDASGINSTIDAHTDHELFTILLQSDGIKALEVVNSEGYWVPAQPIPDTFVVNIGDALAIWTNNVFLSTVHRATNAAGVERISVPFFFGANYDTVMHTLPSCISESRPLKYKSVTAGEHYQMKMNSSYGQKGHTTTT
ncbi:hypothetical protein LTR67_003079 [Exophiala xenobiotica]